MNPLTPKQEEIAALAYNLYVQEGCQQGRDVDYWLRAEKQLGGHFFTAPTTPKSAPTEVKAAKKPASKKAAAAPVKKPVAQKITKMPAKKAVKKKA